MYEANREELLEQNTQIAKIVLINNDSRTENEEYSQTISQENRNLDKPE